MVESLKPCPFCGGVGRIWGRSGRTGTAVKTMYWRGYVIYEDCGATTGMRSSGNSAIRAWNKRYQQDSTA